MRAQYSASNAGQDDDHVRSTAGAAAALLYGSSFQGSDPDLREKYAKGDALAKRLGGGATPALVQKPRHQYRASQRL